MASIDVIVNELLLIYISYDFSFKSYDWTMVTFKQLTFALSMVSLIPSYPSFCNSTLNFFTGITNLVGNHPFVLFIFWYLISILGNGINLVANNF